MINREATLRKMRKAQHVSHWVALASAIVFVFLWRQTMTVRSDPRTLVVGATMVGIVVRIVMSFAYCRRAVRCPNCHASLWSCAYHGYGRGGATIMKPHVDGCPQCHASFTTARD